MMLDLKKVIEPGTWRWIGQRVQGLDFNAIPVAGRSIDAIAGALGGTAFQVRRLRVENAFVVQAGVLSLLYVRPDYRAYRRAASLVFSPCAWPVDYDHALGRSIASRLGYAYVLLLRMPPGVNRSHGHLERAFHLSGAAPDICFADERIRSKWIGRPAGRMLVPAQPYSPHSPTNYGLTLRQAGKWGFAMGVDDDPREIPGLRRIRLS